MKKRTVKSQDPESHRRADRAWQWRTILKAAALGSIVISLISAIVFEPEVPIAVGVLVVIGLLWIRRPGIGGVIYTGTVHLLVGLIVLVLFQNIKELAYPVSVMVFVTTGARLVATITATVASVATLLLDPGGRGSRAFGLVTALSLAAIVGLGVAARLSYTSETPRRGDQVLRITAETMWSSKELRVQSGQVSIYVMNEDVHHGNFTIDGVVAFDIPAGLSNRATFILVPGSYRFYSKLYPEEPGMRGLLLVR